MPPVVLVTSKAGQGAHEHCSCRCLIRWSSVQGSTKCRNLASDILSPATLVHTKYEALRQVNGSLVFGLVSSILYFYPLLLLLRDRRQC